MQSLKELYKIGNGPSSSHTMGVKRAAEMFYEKHESADDFSVTLFGSLAQTGKGHMSDKVLSEFFASKDKRSTVVFDTDTAVEHPNTLTVSCIESGNRTSSTFISVGGGSVAALDEVYAPPIEAYKERSFSEIKKYCLSNNLRLSDYVRLVEGEEIYDYLALVWKKMCLSLERGIAASGVFAGGLNIERKAKFLINQRHIDESAETRENRLVCAYAFAVSEENAGGGEIVTAPTCGSSGVVPAVLYYVKNRRNFTDDRIIRALAAAGVIGNVIKTNASISGAECGCQAEIGSACSMAAAALGELYEMDIDQIEYASEIAMEHHLGLTCDPIGGLVQIPCIERNAVAAMRAINAVSLANFLTNSRKISFDMVVETMRETGKDMDKRYRETSKGGLAKLYSEEMKWQNM